jgi:hypothetical protein
MHVCVCHAACLFLCVCIGSGGDPKSFPLVRAVRIQNLPLWRDYAHRKEAMLAKYGNDALAHSDANEWLRTRPILTATNQVTGLLERCVNEHYLFHVRPSASNSPPSLLYFLFCHAHVVMLTAASPLVSSALPCIYRALTSQPQRH